MKKLILLVITCIIVASNATASCNKGCSEYHGNCACDEKPYQAIPVAPSSDEAPPRSGMPSWQDPSVKADMPQSNAFEDMKMDLEKAEADAQGKRAAGIEPFVGKPGI